MSPQLTQIISAALVLFFVMDPLGNIPLFTTILSRLPANRRRKVLARELVIALVFLVGFYFLGEQLLTLLGLEQEAIRVGGGIVLLVIAMRMIFPQDQSLFGEVLEDEPLVFPLAVPLIAGPSAFATVLLLVDSLPRQTPDGLIAIVGAWSVSAVILSAAPLLLRFIGRRGLSAAERLMGMLLLMLATQMMMDGIAAYLG
jgi:multiple antibiotic resistance protein